MILLACPSCSVHVRGTERTCPQCNSRLRNDRGAVVRTTGAVLMGLALTACPAEDDGDDSIGSASAAMDGTSGGEASLSTTNEPDPSTNGGGEPDYGGPATAGWGSTTDDPGSESSTGDAGSSTGNGSTGGSSTGDATSGSSGGSSTGIGEPEYGVPTTGE